MVTKTEPSMELQGYVTLDQASTLGSRVPIRIPIRPYQVTLDNTNLWLPTKHDDDGDCTLPSRQEVPRGRPIKWICCLSPTGEGRTCGRDVSAL